ncbi:transmembrane protein 44 [Cyprinodon tularosa]|uniref:transmembrane protein 44 n=1 Tax=Cyprinodon tularosa TaxID=77115 RepID=UPI0018E215C8|nr:transmembrane protein 44 [Cyprinodon tularosa]
MEKGDSSQTAEQFAGKMDEGVSITDDQLRGSSDHFLSSLGAFWFHSIATCLSPDAHKTCVPAALTLLSAFLLLLSSLLVACQSCKLRGENAPEAIMVFYCFLGNLCNTVGAVLSRQLHIQIFMGAFAAVKDAVHCILCCLPVFLCWSSQTQRRLSAMKKRRGQQIFAVGVLMVVAGGFLRSRVDDPPALRPVGGRRLMHSFMQFSSWNPIMDNKEILGYILGLLACIIAWTSRLPTLSTERKGQEVTQMSVFSELLSSISGALYAAAILLYDIRFVFLIRVMPWLLSSIGCAILDLLIVVMHQFKTGTRQKMLKLSPDTERLLGLHPEHTSGTKQQKKQQKPSQTKTRNIQKLMEMGQYMDVSGQQTTKVLSLKEVTLSKDGSDGKLPHKMMRVVRAGGLSSSDTSYSSSSDSTDLEWDFEAAVTQWSKPASKAQKGNEFTLQDWPTNPKPFSVCVCSMAGLPQKSLCSAKESSSAMS